MWRIACGLVMSPPYVHSHPRVISADLAVNNWDGSLAAVVDLVTPPPAALRNLRREDGRMWWNWPTERGLHDTVYYQPMVTERDVAERPYLITSTKALFTVPTEDLPASGPQEDIELVAPSTVEKLVWLLNREVRPLIESILSQTDADRLLHR
jgi:hypothetical protein